MRYILASLLLSLATTASAITTGQVEVRVYNGTGFTSTYVTMSNGQVIGKTAGLPAAITPFDGVFSSLTSKPTTLSGYGITDAQSKTGALALGGFGSITGTLPAANGGTGQTTLQASINALLAASGALSQGDLFYFNGTNIVRLAAGTNGQYLKTQGAGANPIWDTASSGLTIGSTAISGGTSGRLLMSGTTVVELTLGSGIATWLTTPTETNFKAAQSGLAWLDTAQTFTAAQTVTAPANSEGLTINGSLTGGGVTRSVLKVIDDWSGTTGGTSSGTLLDLAVNDTGGAPSYGATRAIKFTRNGVELFYINHGGSMFIAGGVSIDGNYQFLEMPSAYAVRWGNWQTSLYRDIAGILHQRSENGTYAQAFRVNNTFASTTNFECGVIDWQTSTNVLRIGSDVGSGGGTARSVHVIRGGVVQMIFDQDVNISTLPFKLATYEVATLPSAVTCGAGSMAFVTDATATTAYSVVVGGGSNKVLVISDGTDWIIH